MYGQDAERLFSLLPNLIDYNYFLRKSMCICIKTSPCYQGPQCFLCFVLFSTDSV